MDPSEHSAWERGLLSAVQAGDERAWRTWYEESFADLYAYALWRCARLRNLADEVVQETWLTAVRRITTFDPDQGSFAGWLRGIAANVVRNQLRQRNRIEQQAVSLNGHCPAGPTPESSADAERIAQALADLPERYENVLRSKYLDQQSVDQIATAWNETPKAVESLLTRARQAFKAAYLSQE